MSPEGVAKSGCVERRVVTALERPPAQTHNQVE